MTIALERSTRRNLLHRPGQKAQATVETRVEASLIGTAPTTETYVMLEWAHPSWAEDALRSRDLPTALWQTAALLRKQAFQPRFFLIYRPESKYRDRHRIFIFRRPAGFASGYEAWERDCMTPEQISQALVQYFRGDRSDWQLRQARDIFICTHGSRDRCCGQLGHPLYREAEKIRAQHDLKDLELWQISHIGGHRFAPTLIDLPQGRYYGCLDRDRLQTLLCLQGDLINLHHSYRGTTLLPEALQELEQKYFLHHGWSWLEANLKAETRSAIDHPVNYQNHRDSNHSDNSTESLELIYQLPHQRS
jgi:hypothetical protein